MREIWRAAYTHVGRKGGAVPCKLFLYTIHFGVASSITTRSYSTLCAVSSRPRAWDGGLITQRHLGIAHSTFSLTISRVQLLETASLVSISVFSLIVNGSNELKRERNVSCSFRH